MCSGCSGDYENPDVTTSSSEETPGGGEIHHSTTPSASSPAGDCELCGESFCKHGLCTNRGACPNSRDKEGWDCQDCAEEAEQRAIEAYYGGDGPQTLREEMEVAARDRWRER